MYNVRAEYSGGGIYIYSGSIDEGTWFLTSDDWCPYVILLDVDPFDPRYEDTFTFEWWQEAHMVGELAEAEGVRFWVGMLNALQESGDLTSFEYIRRREAL